MSGPADNEVFTLEPEDFIVIDVAPSPIGGEAIDLSFLVPGRDTRAAELEIIRLTNEMRQQHGLAPLIRNAQLDQSAMTHTLEMAEYGFVGHTGVFGSSLKDRVRDAGYNNFRVIGENLARGQRTPGEAVDGWMKSPGHRDNLLHPAFREIGVACLEGRVVTSGGVWSATYWTQNFGARLEVGTAYSLDQLLTDAGHFARQWIGARRAAQPMARLDDEIEIVGPEE